jgi:hypothetical protein
MFENTVTGTPAPHPPTALLKNPALHTTTNNTSSEDKARNERCDEM